MYSINALDTYNIDESGINSLRGYAYQIKVFVLCILSINDDMQVGFEVIDDVSIKKLTPETIDDNEDKFRSSIYSCELVKAIQVKRTSFSKDDAKQILFNWILLESSKEQITDYILFTDSSYKNKDIIFKNSVEDLYEEVLNTKRTSKATVAKIKDKFKKNKTEFIRIYKSIKDKYTFVAVDMIDNKIDEKCKLLFRKTGVTTITYYNRISELLKHITFEIMKCVNEKEPYRMKYEELMACSEDICCRITDKFMYPAYSEFKRLNKIDFTDLKIAKSREYKQLLACKMPQKLIEMHLQYRNYYQDVCYKYLELNKTSIIQDIEETTYENFENVKFILQNEGQDTPFNRLKETNKCPNSYANNDQIKYGSGIYLTREEEKERQISWEDDDNAES